MFAFVCDSLLFVGGGLLALVVLWLVAGGRLPSVREALRVPAGPRGCRSEACGVGWVCPDCGGCRRCCRCAVRRVSRPVGR